MINISDDFMKGVLAGGLIVLFIQLIQIIDDVVHTLYLKYRKGKNDE